MRITQIIVDELPENCIKCSLHWCPLAVQNTNDTTRHSNCILMLDKNIKNRLNSIILEMQTENETIQNMDKFSNDFKTGYANCMKDLTLTIFSEFPEFFCTHEILDRTYKCANKTPN